MMSIIPLKSLDDAIIILRNKIIDITKLDGQFVLNALSIYGTDMSKVLLDAQDGIKQDGINPTETINDTLILFEPRNEPDSLNNMMQKEDAYSAYILHVIMYGEHAEELSMMLKANLLQIDVKAKLNYDGIQISRISDIEAMNEFKNETMWQRRDMDVHFAFRREYTFE